MEIELIRLAKGLKVRVEGEKRAQRLFLNFWLKKLDVLWYHLLKFERVA